MKKIMMLATIVAIGMTAQAVVIDTWDMNGNGPWQTSDNGIDGVPGITVGPHLGSANQSQAQTDDDGVFLLDPTNISGNSYSGKTPLSTVINVSATPIVRLTLDINNINLSGDAATHSQFGVRLWDNRAGNDQKFVNMIVRDNGAADKVFAYAATGNSIDGSYHNWQAGRLVNGLVGTASSKVVMDIDFANDEIRMYAPDNWNYAPDGVGQVFTNSMDLSSVAQIDNIQLYSANWDNGAGDFMELNELTVEAIPEPATLGLVVAFGGAILFIRRSFMM